MNSTLTNIIYIVSQVSQCDNIHQNYGTHSIDIKFNEKLDNSQLDIINECIRILKSDNYNIISIPRGNKKVLLIIYIIHILKLKTLIITHKNILSDQWIEQLERSTNAQIGVIKKDSVSIIDKDITISTHYNIIRHDSNILRNFGLIIFDEYNLIPLKFLNNSLRYLGMLQVA